MKRLILMTVLTATAVFTVGCGSADNSSLQKADQSVSITENNESDTIKNSDESKILIAYFSYPLTDGVDASSIASRVIVDGELTGSVEYMAKVIQSQTGADIFTIHATESYGDDFGTVADKAQDEQRKEILPALSTHIENLDDYDTIFVGYPIWWYDMPQVMYSFFDEYDFSGKTIIPFNSHGGSRFSGSVERITDLEPNATVRTDGLTIDRDSVSKSGDAIIEWINGLGL